MSRTIASAAIANITRPEPATVDIRPAPRQRSTPALPLGHLAAGIALAAVLVAVTVALTLIATADGDEHAMSRVAVSVLTTGGATVLACLFLAWYIGQRLAAVERTRRSAINGLTIDISQLVAGQVAAAEQLAKLRSELPAMIQHAVNETYAQGAVDGLLKARTQEQRLRPVN